jgi:arginine deiminase
VHHVRDLLEDVFASAEARELMIRGAMDMIPSEPLAREIAELPPADLVRMLVEGREEPAGPLARTLNEFGYSLPPLPNMFFTRDSSMVSGEHVLIGAMRYGTRWTEELIMKTIFSYHPTLANAGILFDGAGERRLNFTLEGGDVHTLREDLMVVGFSERSSPAAIDFLASLLFEQTKVQDLIVVVMPGENTAIHLDMIWTQVDRELCVVYPPHFVGPERLPVLHWHRGDETVHEMPNIFAALAKCGMPMEPVFCGGQQRIFQEREQWASGCNFLTLRPGLVLSYARNERTMQEMRAAGFRIVRGVSLLTGEERISETERAVIAFEGGELVRGGGGPRCMSCPVHRDDPWS